MTGDIETAPAPRMRIGITRVEQSLLAARLHVAVTLELATPLAGLGMVHVPERLIWCVDAEPEDMDLRLVAEIECAISLSLVAGATMTAQVAYGSAMWRGRAEAIRLASGRMIIEGTLSRARSAEPRIWAVR